MAPAVPRGNKNLGDRVKVLLADDSVTMHRAVKLALKNEPYEVITCDNGQDALRLCLEQHPKIILADLDMPLMSGAEVAVAIKKNPLLQAVKVVLLCGSFDQVDESKLGAIPTDGRIWKPFEAHTLVAMLKTLLQQGEAAGEQSLVRESSTPTGALPTPAAKQVAPKTPEPAAVRNSPEVTSPSLEKGLTDETFQEAEKSSADFTPPELRTRTRTEVPFYTPALEPQREVPAPEEPEFEAISPDDAKENLWTDDYKIEEAKREQKSEFAEPRSGEDTQWDIPAAEISSTPVSDQFEIVTSNLNLDKPELPASETYLKPGITPPESQPSTAVPQLFQEEEWVRDRDFTDYQAEGGGIQEHRLDEVSTPGKLFGESDSQTGKLSEELIRKIIQEELQGSIKDVLKEILQEELSKVLAEIERD